MAKCTAEGRTNPRARRRFCGTRPGDGSAMKPKAGLEPTATSVAVYRWDRLAAQISDISAGPRHPVLAGGTYRARHPAGSGVLIAQAGAALSAPLPEAALCMDARRIASAEPRWQPRAANGSRPLANFHVALETTTAASARSAYSRCTVGREREGGVQLFSCRWTPPRRGNTAPEEAT
jgi:hypothetical protein